MTATVYLGTSRFAARVLGILAGSPHRPVLVLSRPDAPQGRGRRLAAPPVIDAAVELGLPIAQPDSVNRAEVVEVIRAAGAEVVVVCAFGAIIREPLLGGMEILNVHPSLLPRWRGAAPIERAILAGDERTGVSIMALTAGLDSGPVCLRDETPIGPEDDYGSLSERLEAIGADLLIRALDERPPFVPQPDAGVTYAEKITAADRRLDPGDEDALTLARRVRALSPHIGAFLEDHHGGRLGVWSARAVSTGEGPRFVACRSGTLELLSVQPPGGRRMDAADWARGR
ncbi:methionyl-tRNA formyltransferase [Conexibacter sp. DBS9H8]|uniref:methionyl-tRNA formyltransferase n=1 Tax=Conexibacter sp. DBS9H8 TaxID=2937801 RepID=UPI00200CF0E4|nr:methionyl-tRNA formyltransferase [Conexibacter sp. DBS9H8]